MSAPPSHLSGEFAGRYTVERELGRGATSIVWLARDLDYGRMVAIKVLRDELTASVAADRFLREIRVTAQLQHPHIVPVLNSGEAGGRLYCVLPYMDGGTLRARLQRDKQLPIAEVVAIGTTVASALAAAHDRNLLHRDVKPENILFTGGQACLSDFGIARAIVYSSGESTTSTGLVRGTPAYMSPEQASGDRDYDGRSDLYALACVLYEAVAGVPAFVGATSQAIVAQRILHAPRPVSVFRPSVSPELEAVLEKALATAPADRYQTATEFAQALAAAPVLPTREHPGRRATPTRFSGRRAGLLMAGAVAIAALGYLGARALSITLPWSRAVLDTNRVAVLPFDGFRGGADDIRPSDLVLDGLQRWSNLSLVEDFAVADAVQRQGAIRTTGDAQRVAKDLSAGRFIRGQLIGAGAGQTLEVTAYDTRTGATVHNVRMRIPADSLERIAFYAAVADSFVLRGSRDETGAVSATGFHNAAAAQTFFRARARLRDWDLAAAESLFLKSTEYEGTSPRAFLWLAQIRVWRTQTGPDPTSWRAAAERAAGDTAALPRSERPMAIALRDLGAANYAAACAAYDGIVRSDSASFVGWYGRAQCHDFDNAVIPDRASPTGWRFRSDYQRAIESYTRAFELLPSAYGGFAGGSFTLIRQKLYTSMRYIRGGRALDSTHRAFSARPFLRGDSMVFIPAPLDQGAAPVALTNLAGARAAVLRQRATFHRIAAGWVAALPNAPGAREALAVSLEMLGDPAAVDSFVSASRIATDSTQRLRLAVSAVLMRVKIGLPDRLADLKIARQQAESILAAHKPRGAEESELLSRLAALTGHCDRAATLSRAGARPDLTRVVVPQSVAEDIQARLAYIALGCRVPVNVPTLDELDQRLNASQSSDAAHRTGALFVLSRLVGATFPVDSSWLQRIATPQSTIPFAELSWMRGDAAGARRLLDGFWRTTESSLPGDVTADVALTEARLRLGIRDTAGARRALDRTLAGARYYAPMSEYEREGNVLVIGSLVRAARLRAVIAGDDGNSVQRWNNAVEALWSNADQELRSSIAGAGQRVR